MEAFLVGGGGQWIGMARGGTLRIYRQRQKFETSYDAYDSLTQNTGSTPTE